MPVPGGRARMAGASPPNARQASTSRSRISARAGRLHLKWVIAVNPDIDINNSAEVDWPQCFRVKPSTNVEGSCEPLSPCPAAAGMGMTNA